MTSQEEKENRHNKLLFKNTEDSEFSWVKLNSLDDVKKWILLSRNAAYENRNDALNDNNILKVLYNQGIIDMLTDLYTALTSGLIDQKVKTEKPSGYL